ncbi:hypothetical protein PUN28_002365 [Cardiocondyla obscurior]|uniref:Uncharacterized protein n=1 Tax=Cardiocondyla obscurior TaxID=286306 RepID=A0AAW2GU21_9HYME
MIAVEMKNIQNLPENYIICTDNNVLSRYLAANKTVLLDPQPRLSNKIVQKLQLYKKIEIKIFIKNLFIIDIYRIPHMRNLFANGNILCIIAIPILSALIYFSTAYFNFFSIFITSSTYICQIFILALVFAPIVRKHH